MKIKMKSLVVGTLLLSSLAHAQSGAQGGGNFTEAQMKDFMGELSRYFSDPQSSGLFPEVGAWEKANNAKFSDLIQSIEPKVVNHKVYGPFKEERDCVSFVNGSTRYFECDSSRVPEARLENQPLLYMILLHEAFVHAGVEKPTSETVPSKYPVSSRIGNTQNLSLVTYQKWVPKKVESSNALKVIKLDQFESCDQKHRLNLSAEYQGAYRKGDRYVLIGQEGLREMSEFSIDGHLKTKNYCVDQKMTGKTLTVNFRAVDGYKGFLARDKQKVIIKFKSNSIKFGDRYYLNPGLFNNGMLYGFDGPIIFWDLPKLLSR